MAYDKKEDQSEWLQGEYSALFSYYLWTLQNRNSMLTVYIAVLGSASAGMGVLLKESGSSATLACAAIGAVFVPVGFLFVQRLVSNTVSSIWAFCRLNEVRRHVREQLELAIFRDLVADTYRPRARLALLRYRLTVTSLVINMNSLVAGLSATFLLWPVSVPCSVGAGIATMGGMWLLQRIYANDKLDVVRGYLEGEAEAFVSEVRVVNSMFSGGRPSPLLSDRVHKEMSK